MVLFGLSLLALLLAVSGLSYELPDGIRHSDTPKQLHRVALFMRGEIVPDGTYPTLHMYVVALILKSLSLVDPHSVEGGPSLAQVAVTARLLNAVLAAGIVALTHQIARTLLGATGALLAAALVAVSQLLVLHAHYEMGEVTQAFFVTACVAAALRIRPAEGARTYLLAGGLAGLAASAKYYGAIVLVAVVVATLRGRRTDWRRTVRLALLAATAALAVFVLTTPKLLRSPAAFLAQLPRSRELVNFGHYTLLERPLVGGRNVLGLCLDWFGPLLTAAAVLGAVALVRRRPGGPVTLVTPALAVAMFILLRPGYLDDRYLVILVPFVAVAAAALVIGLAGRARTGRLLATTLGAALLLLGARDAAHTAYVFWQDQTKDFATRWSRHHLPPRSRPPARGRPLTATAAEARNWSCSTRSTTAGMSTGTRPCGLATSKTGSTPSGSVPSSCSASSSSLVASRRPPCPTTMWPRSTCHGASLLPTTCPASATR